jgi:hypothetical protein
MPYALLNADGHIDSLHASAVPGAEFFPADHPQVLAFLGGEEHKQHFASLDADLVRVLEDLVDVLIMRNIIRITDLPPEAQQKLFARKNFRERMNDHSLRLLGHGHDGSLEKEVVATQFGNIP